ncbi:NACHT domain-containing protein [Actinokineospora diospyrosa]|uniref:NACHT domain-containing protein n=1 Tax=Actinokineospora diospyrosa TaxID=103728 RepID=A0ABT1I797_9PSEU|nr:NACHT domain-containing protein [Actinokineospora diospyrosa]MCP2268498.1 NACHT domain-containing protein [Actinokineospora diospyrosa]
MTVAVLGGVLAVLVVLGGFVAKQFFGEYLKRSGATAFDRTARWYSRRAKFGRRLVRRYAEAVREDFSTHAMGFVTDGTIDITKVYVPLQYERGGRREDIYDNVRAQSRTVVIGPAGAGKSMLLKNSMLLWAKQPSSTRVPVFIELHRCNGSTATLIDLIVAELGRSRLDRDGRIRDLTLRGLRDGAFTLLLDGLDEVGRDDQQRVFEALRDLAREYPECQYIVTCRDVVYQGQPLGSAFAHVVRVAEFDDAAVVRFLSHWPGLTDAAELFVGLRDTPALMRLARSPLLLTMIAYLHTEVLTRSGRRLPTSRTAFYREAITHLLNRDPDLGRARSVYQAGEKLAVLQQVALRSMESTGDDRLTLSRRALESTTKDLLPDLNLDQSKVKDLLDEIIDRSQLLVATDKARTGFTFRHLTLQEYLTAVELADDPEGLLDRYHADRAAWRETVKLWCGATTRDCTSVIAEVFSAPDHHRVLALECLAEATRVDNEFADVIIAHFLDRLGTDAPVIEAIVTALGTVASDTRPRGARLFAALTEIARGAGDAAADAMLALSASGRAEAAHVLVKLAGDASARTALSNMGELALPALVSQAKPQTLWAIDDIALVGTPAAAEALAGLLWRSARVATRAAWRLAELLPRPGVLEQIRRVAPADEGIHDFDWVWGPFAEGKDDPLRAICGRVAELIYGVSPPKDVKTIDPRLAIPLAVRGIRDAQPLDEVDLVLVRQQIGERGASTRHAIKQVVTQNTGDPRMWRARAEILRRSKLSAAQQRLIGLLSSPVRVVFHSLLLEEGYSQARRVRREDWATIEAAQRQTKHLWLLCGVLLLPLGIGVVLIGLGLHVLVVTGTEPFGALWLSIAVLAATVVAPLMYLVAVKLPAHRGDLSDTLVGILAILAGCALVPITIAGVVTIHAGIGLVGVGVLAAILVVGAVCALVARAWDRVRDNPFRRCYEAEANRVENPASVIAG